MLCNKIKQWLYIRWPRSLSNSIVSGCNNRPSPHFQWWSVWEPILKMPRKVRGISSSDSEGFLVPARNEISFNVYAQHQWPWTIHFRHIWILWQKTVVQKVHSSNTRFAVQFLAKHGWKEIAHSGGLASGANWCFNTLFFQWHKLRLNGATFSVLLAEWLDDTIHT